MKIVYGEAGVFDPNTTAVELPAPENGDDVDGPPMEGTLQTVANWLSQLGYEITYRDYVGAARLRWVLDIAAVKAITGMAEGHVVALPSLYAAPTVRHPSVFVYDPTSVAPETQLPGMPGTYLVVAPNGGVGRWFNVAVGLGWSLGTEPRFVARGLKRSGIVRQSSVLPDWAPLTGLTGYSPVGIQVDVPPAFCRLDSQFQVVASFCVRLLNAAFYELRIERSINGGTWGELEGSRRRVGTESGADGAWVPVTLVGYDAPDSTLARRYRVTADFADSNEAHLLKSWTIQVQWHWDGV